MSDKSPNATTRDSRRDKEQNLHDMNEIRQKNYNMVVVKRVRTRPGLIKRNSDSLTTILTDQGKSESSSSLKSNISRGSSGKSCTVCFAKDYNIPDEVYPPPLEPMTKEEHSKCFYSVR